MFTSSPRHIAGYNVLLRLLLPRHPPCALKNLTTDIKDARVHCAVLKIRAGPLSFSAYLINNQGVHLNRAVRGRPFGGLKVNKASDPSGPNSVPCVEEYLCCSFQPRRAYLKAEAEPLRHIDVPSMSSRRSTYEIEASPGHPRVPSAP